MQKEEIAPADNFRMALSRLWDEKQGIFANRDSETREFSTRISSTNLYPLMAGAAAPVQARRMIDGFFLDPKKLGGEWILPSITRDDTAYSEQHYWRGRIWAPLNYLVYRGLKRAELHDEAQKF